MSRPLPHAFVSQIQQMLLKRHVPKVIPRTSTVAGAGRGIFATQNIQKNQVVALYPGIYTPAHPDFMNSMTALPIESMYACMEAYLANKVSPSGLQMEDNAYILNVQGIGGYLDGNIVQHRHQRFLENPSACAHLVNHSHTDWNVEIETFVWTRNLIGAPHSDPKDDDERFPIPNQRRCDGSPWYLDGDEIIYFPTDPSSSPENGNAEGTDDTKRSTMVCGAAFVASQDIQQDQELFLNYRLSTPFPKWAKNWYVGTTDSNTFTNTWFL